MRVIEIMSSIERDLLLHRIVLWENETAPNSGLERYDFSEHHFRLQVAALMLPRGQVFPPHLHIDCSELVRRGRAQEAWVILRGKIRFRYYDLDEAPLGHLDIAAPAMTFTNAGGHTYEALDDSLVVEFKSGPYQGADRDKMRFHDPTVTVRDQGSS